MIRGIFCCGVILILCASILLADEQVRRVQEELRKRNLYFGDVDGQKNAELANALKRYQARKGFEVTGQIDEVTATSLNVPMLAASAEKKPTSEQWPDVPVLKSDTARALSPPEQAALEDSSDISPSPAPPAESPAKTAALDSDRVRKFVEKYLHDAQGNDIAAQVRYYSFPAQYFDHGQVDRQFVEQDTRNYCKRWPDRKYMLTAPVRVSAGPKDGEATVEFPIVFRVANKKHTVTGSTKNYWTVRPEGNDLKIFAVREERIRE